VKLIAPFALQLETFLPANGSGTISCPTLGGGQHERPVGRAEHLVARLRNTEVHCLGQRSEDLDRVCAAERRIAWGIEAEVSFPVRGWGTEEFTDDVFAGVYGRAYSWASEYGRGPAVVPSSLGCRTPPSPPPLTFRKQTPHMWGVPQSVPPQQYQVSKLASWGGFVRFTEPPKTNR
jgi:hypothetical protein